MTKQMNVFFLNASCSALFYLAFFYKPIFHYSFFSLYLTMKFLLTCLLVLWGCCAWAQGSAPKELTYSRVIIVDTFATVPAGKVWKVESYLSSGNVNGCDWFLINGKRVWLQYLHGNIYTPSLVNFPFWLPSGNTLDVNYFPNCCGLPAISGGQFSIIEFNEN